MSKATNSLTTNRWADVADEWIAYKDIFESAKKSLGLRKEALVGLVTFEDHHPFTVINGRLGSVAITEKDRRDFDVDLLCILTPADVFEDVTKVVVDPSRFDDAVKDGRISAKKVAKVTTLTPYVDVRKA
jgi:hypothetical protein